MDLTTFAIEALADFRTVGAVAPSSRYLTQAMLGPLSLERARVVVEVGPGTGAMTQALLNLIPFDATLLAFEINSRFSAYLKSHISDSRLVVINASAETLQKEIHGRGYERVDAVVSSLALGLMPDRKRRTFLRELGSLLGEAGVFTQYQYFHRLQMKNGQVRKFHLAHLLQAYFSSVQQRIIWRNLPPAFVFACRGPLSFESGPLLSLSFDCRGHAEL
jgi:phosphatidylethanolamine/phosphatidyl-N-methylethanolamine N-methyltransferase